MKTILTLIICLMPVVAFGWGSATYTFKQISSATKAKIRVATMAYRLPREGATTGNAVQVFAPSKFDNYSCTKSKTIPVTGIAALIQVDQDTDLYLGSDLTNKLLIPSGTSNFLIGIP